MSTLNALQQKIKTHYEMSQQLDAAYGEVWGDMVVYLRTSSLTDDEAEDLVEDITAMMLEAQARGATVSETFGRDYQKFCDDIIASKGKAPLKEKAQNTLQLVLGCFNISLFFAWFNTLERKGRFTLDNLMTVNLSVAMLLTMVIIIVAAILILKWFHKRIYDKQYEHMPAWRKALPAILACVVITALTFAVRTSFNHIVLARVHIGWLALLMVVVWGYGKYVAGRNVES